ncbi:class I SAM-dependent methyltransferase [Ktedonospora formicarum]|uniref:Type 11 methyltransferase n=1 Tax=Ktedonospora formicarum TaxID=2778364 RepID=A0A8J3IC51_9CHLR|nr:methyltransferase domain-containing protein [Ktedonospora formicarum]GHO51286.1 type 11 methyltransferase [Ktedonospora formicarum]
MAKETQIEKVVHYYTIAARDYKQFWTGPEDLAMHFGYYDDTKGISTHEEALLHMNNILAGYAHITPEDRVLDAGCGYGGSSLWLAGNVGCQVTGITLVQEQVQEAQAAAQRRQLEHRTQFECMDFAHTTFADATFDVIWTLESLVHAEHKRDFLREAFRLLRPGGRLLISEYMLREDPPLSSEQQASLTPWLTGWVMPNLLTPDEYTSMMREEGFGAIQVRNLTEWTRLSISRLGKTGLPVLPAASLAIVLTRILSLFRLFRKERVHNFEAGVCMNQALRKGLWQYIVIIAQKPSASAMHL